MRRRTVLNETVVSAELDDEVVLLNVETGTYFGLDAIGSRIWRLLAQGAAEGDILERLLAEYDVEPAQLRSDLSGFLGVLTAKGLVRQGVP
jgi:hypothetical protein